MTLTRPKTIHLCDITPGMIIEGKRSDQRFEVVEVQEFSGHKPMFITVKKMDGTTSFIEGRRRDIMWRY